MIVESSPGFIARLLIEQRGVCFACGYPTTEAIPLHSRQRPCEHCKAQAVVSAHLAVAENWLRNYTREYGDADMQLPVGKACVDCAHFKVTCEWLISCAPTNVVCDWSPSRFRPQPALPQ